MIMTILSAIIGKVSSNLENQKDFILLFLHITFSDYEVVEPEMFCTGYYEQNVNDGSISRLGIYSIHANSFLPTFNGNICPVGQFCIQDEPLTPEWTYLSFRNIYYAMVNVFTVISIEDWSYMMYMSQDATSTIGAPIFYIFCVYFMTFIMVPLFVGKYCSYDDIRHVARRIDLTN